MSAPRLTLAPSITSSPGMMVFVVAFLIVLGANGPALYAWVKLWALDGLEYGFIVLAASLWLLWRVRSQLRETVAVPDWRGLCVVMPIGLATWLAYVLDVRIAQYALLIPGVAALILTVLGGAALRVLAAPLSFFVLALPVWNYFQPALQAMTVQVTAAALELTGTPTFVDETYIHTPQGAILVLSQCSGSQYFQAGVTIGALYAVLGFRSLRLRALVVLGFATMAALGNWIRVFVVVHLGALSEWQHFLVGWGIFALLLVAALGVGLRLQAREERSFKPLPRTPAAGPEAYAMQPPPAIVPLAAVATMLLAAGPVEALLPATAPAMARGRAAPMSVSAPWSGPFAPDRSWQPSFAGAAAQMQASYRSDGSGAREESGTSDADVMSAYWAWYPRQGRRSQAVNQTNSVYSAPWEPRGGYAGTHFRSISVGVGSFEVIETRLWNPQSGAERLVWHWYCIAGHPAVRPWRAKMLQARWLLAGRSYAGVAAISTDARDPRAARDLLQQFVTDNFPRWRASICTERQ